MTTRHPCIGRMIAQLCLLTSDHEALDWLNLAQNGRFRKRIYYILGMQ